MPRSGKARLLLAAFMAAALAMLAPPAQAYRPRILQIGFVPSENATQMAHKAAPLLAQISKRIGMKTVSFVATDYPGVVEAMRHRKVDAAFLAPLPSVMAERIANGRILLKTVRHGLEVYYSAIITRHDSGIRTLNDLKGKRFAFGDPYSMAGTIFPKALLREHGIDPERDLTPLPPMGHDATVLNVFNKHADAGAVFANDPAGKEGAWSFFLKTKVERDQIRVIALSKPIPNDTFTVRADLDPDLVENLKGALLEMSATDEGRKRLTAIYHLDGLIEADRKDYAPVREALDALGIKL